MSKFQNIAFMLMVAAHSAAAYESDKNEREGTSCGDIKAAYKAAGCCGQPGKDSGMGMIPMPATMLAGDNECAGKKVGFNNTDCLVNDAVAAAEQSGTNVTKGYKGSLKTDAKPITTSYMQAGLCPVNVHWHLGTEHLSVGEFDEDGVGPSKRRLASGGEVDRGFQCHHYDDSDKKFTSKYEWLHCVDMKVGETYEIHWPHSSMGACGTPSQYQTPFYDGVFCRYPDALINSTQRSIAVQAQIFTVVNDEEYYYPDLMRGMIIDGEMGADVAKYTGSTTGPTRSNTICSGYAPITWQVDRKCHLISASSFDKMCADMKLQRDDMSGDLHAHGARELVLDEFAANNHQRRAQAENYERL